MLVWAAGKYLASPAHYQMGLLAATAAYVLLALIEAPPAPRRVPPAQQSRASDCASAQPTDARRGATQGLT
jgi:hypothetical protein